MSSPAARAKRAPYRRAKAAAKRQRDRAEFLERRALERGAFFYREKDGSMTLMNRAERRSFGFRGPLPLEFAEQREKARRRRSSTVAEVRAKLERVAARVGIGGAVID
ncbi:MAG TPA: hypothetical protein VF156_15465 [Agromyces sp.]